MNIQDKNKSVNKFPKQFDKYNSVKIEESKTLITVQHVYKAIMLIYSLHAHGYLTSAE